MKKTVIAFATFAAMAAASDRTGVYARIDKVVLEPVTGAADRVQVWGVFALAKADDRNFYLPAVRGYLYFKVSDSPEAARREWADLKQVAGTGQIVALGTRLSRPTLRKKDEAPANPDPYPVNVGVHKIQGMTDYPPVRELRDFRD